MSARATAAKALTDHLMAVIRHHKGHPFAVVLVVGDPADLANLHVAGTSSDVDHLRMAGAAVEKIAAILQPTGESSPPKN